MFLTSQGVFLQTWVGQDARGIVSTDCVEHFFFQFFSRTPGSVLWDLIGGFDYKLPFGSRSFIFNCRFTLFPVAVVPMQKNPATNKFCDHCVVVQP